MLLSVPCLQHTVFFLATLSLISAQQEQQNDVVPKPTPTSASVPPSSTIYTTYTSIFATTLTPGQPRPTGAPISQSVFLATTTVTSALFTLTPSPTALPIPTTAVPAPSSTVHAETGLPLHTIIDPAFGILGALLISTGAILAFIGHRSRWLICLISGFYSFALVTLCVILRVGVARALDDPTKTLKGIYLLACICAGGIGGAAFVIFRQGGLLLSSSLGGFTSALYLQAFKSNGLIEPIGLRYILYLGLTTLAFSLACQPRLQAYILIFSSAIVGSTTIVLGIDCFTRANLKEFHIRNLGFDDLFDKKYPDEFRHHRWFLSTASIIELGVIGGLTLMAISFQGKMWAEFRASLSLMRHDDEERRLQSRAKRAAKKIFATAQSDLRDWEERHGYRKTATRPDIQDDGHANPQSGSSNMYQQPSKGSALSLLSMKINNQSSTSPIEYPPTLAYEPPSSESIGLLSSPMSGSMTLPQELKGQLHEGLSRAPLTSEQQTLLEEIANIRKSIDVLRSASPGSAIDASSDTHEANKRASFSSMMHRSRDEISNTRSPSPWQSRERTRARSITTMMEETAPVNSDLFAGSERKSPIQRNSSPGLAFHFEEPPRPSSVMLTRLEAPSSTDRRPRAGSESNILQSAAVNSHSYHISQPESKSDYAMMMPASSERHLSHSSSIVATNPRPQPSRIIVETKEEAAAGVAKTLNREVPHRSHRKSDASSPIEYSKSNSRMSLGELQARHESRLKALQSPTSQKIFEEASIIKAKEDWARRSQLEKNRWDTIEREQRREVIPMQNPERPRQSTKSKSFNLNMTSPATVSDALDAIPEQSGISRAKEWRNSLQVDTNHQASVSLATRRRHSAHSQPILDFTTEAIHEHTKGA